MQERKLSMQHNQNFALRSQNIKESISLAKLLAIANEFIVLGIHDNKSLFLDHVIYS